MKTILATLLIGVLALFSGGCGNLSPKFQPKNDQKIDNTDGKIRDISTEQNGMKNEILSLKQQAEIANSKLDRIQQGFANYQSNQTNSGLQILSGSGGLMVAVIAIIVGGVIWFYRDKAITHEKAATILAQQINQSGDEALKEQVFQAALYTDVESKVYALMRRNDGESN